MNPITEELMLEFSSLSQLIANPARSHATFVKAQANVKRNDYDHRVYFYDGKTITRYKAFKTKPSVRYIDDDTLFIGGALSAAEARQMKQNQTSLWRLYRIAKDILEAPFTLPISLSIEGILSDGSYLASASLTPDQHRWYRVDDTERQALIKEAQANALYEDITTLPYLFNGRDFITDQRSTLLRIDASTHAIEALVDSSFHVDTWTLSHDRTTVYIAGAKWDTIKPQTADIYTYDVSQKSLKALTQSADHNVQALFELEGSLLVMARDMKTYGLNQNPDIYRIENGTLTQLKKFGHSIYNTVGTDVRYGGSAQSGVHGDHGYFVTTRGSITPLMTFNQDGALTTVYEPDGAIDGVVPFGSDYLMIGLFGQQLQELYRLDAATQKPQRLTRFNVKPFKDKTVHVPHPLSVSFDTHTVDGFVITPHDYVSQDSVPVILNIHGGPKTVYSSLYYHEMQVWASQGYAVIFANPRGSDGKGDAFADIRGRYGTIDYDDLMAFTDAAMQAYPKFDPNRLYVTGGSYGGFMTNWMIGHTDRFKAAVTQRCISNWESFYGTSDIGYGFGQDQTAGNPLDNLAIMRKQSPITYADRMKTPLLIIHSDKDQRCPIEQAQQLYTVLMTRKIPTKMVWFKNENHELSRSGKPQARLKRLREISGWFESYR